jgi:hypothetical protein
MNREESLRVINGFIKQLDKPDAEAVPHVQATAAKQEIRPAAAPTCNPTPIRQTASPPVRVAPANSAPTENGLGSLIKGCPGFDISSPSPPPAAPLAASATGLGALIKNCNGFEISASPSSCQAQASPPIAGAATASYNKDAGLSAVIKGCTGFEIGGGACCPAPTQAPAAAPAASTPPPVQPPDPETLAIRKATERLNNKPLLASLLKYYASEAQKNNPSLMMLRSTKDSIMKGWPQLVFSPLISALDGAIS